MRDIGRRLGKLEGRVGVRCPPGAALAELVRLIEADPETMELHLEMQRRSEGQSASPRWSGLSGNQLLDRFTARLAGAPNARALMYSVAMSNPPIDETRLRNLRGY